MRALSPPLAALFLLASGCVAPSARPNDGDGALRWSGNLQFVQQRTGAVAPTGQSKAYGTVTLDMSARDRNRTRVQLLVNLPTAATTQLTWALVPGRCGSGGLPVMAIDQFPVLDVNNNGRGQLDVEIPLTLPPSGSYHVNVYRGGHQLNDVLTCANLRRSGGV